MSQYAVYASGTYNNHGVINGFNGGIEFTARGDMINYGSIYGQNGNGVLLTAGFRVTNLGSIRAFGGHGNGISAFGAQSVVDNAGVVISNAAAGVALHSGGYVNNLLSASEILGKTNGVYISGGAGHVDNFGTIEGTGGPGVYSVGVYLQAGGDVLNGYGTAVVTGGYDGILVAGGSSYIDNHGSISGTQHAGVDLFGGIVTNRAGGLVTGGGDGVEMVGGAGSVANAGTISGGIAGINLLAGGTVSNAASGVISGTTYGVYIQTAGGSVSNSGTIVASGGPAVTFGADGYLVNTGSIYGSEGVYMAYNPARANSGRVVNQAGSIRGGFIGVLSNGANASVLNQAYIGGLNAGVGLFVNDSGTVTNASNGVIVASSRFDSNGVEIDSATGTVANAGVIRGYGRSGVELIVSSGGRVDNASTGLISGHVDGVHAVGAPVVVTNSGSIFGGTGAGIYLPQGGTVSNTSGGRIHGYYGIRASGSTISITNTGTIVGSGTRVGVGVLLSAGGVITNQAGGRISGAVGVLVSGGNATVTDAGTISGNTYAVQFTGGGTDRLILDPGAVLSGKVSGAGAHSTLELAAGSSTISGLGSNFVGFEQVVVDRGASWTLTQANSLAAGSTLAVAGTLTVAGALVDSGAATIAGTLRSSGAGAVRIGQGASMTGGSVLAPGSTGAIEIGGAGRATKGMVTVDAGATLRGAGSVASAVRDNGSVRASGGTLRVAGSLVGSGFATIDSHSVLSVGGALGTAKMVFLSGGSETAVLGSPTAVSAAISGFAATDTLDLVGFAATRLSFANDVLTVDRAVGGAAHLHFSSAYAGHHFAAASDGHGGTNIHII